MEVKRQPKPDSVDAKLMRDMLGSSSFQLILTRVNAELVRAVGTCERSVEGIEIYRAQGAAAALRMVLGIPNQILTEIAKK